MKRIFLLGLFSLFLALAGTSEPPKVWKSGEIYQAIEKLNFLGSVLYVAAHPDDENTRLISYFANHVKARTAYLSLTRGDGGQNLIGPEIRELLGVIRTEELMAARRIDGGEQVFSRANDFGYSKNPEETLKIWDEEQVLSDVVWAIRKFKPDIIINRFQHDTDRSTHGHHTSSAILSHKAFDLTNDPEVFPSQLKYVEPHQTRRLFFNTGWWFYGSREAFAKADKTGMISIDVGTYYPIIGKSNSEIAAESRSQHKCQGMGNTGSRGSSEEYVQLLKGDIPKSESNIFEGINTTWSMVKGGKAITKMVRNVLDNFQFTNPHRSVPALLKIYQKINALEDGYWKEVKLQEIKEIIIACSGLYLEAVTDIHTVVPGEMINVRVEATNRSPVDFHLESINFIGARLDSVINVSLKNNQAFLTDLDLKVPVNTTFTAPYWLTEKGSLGMYKVENQKLIGNPESDRALYAQFNLKINDVSLSYKTDIPYKYNSPEDGPVYRPLEVTPELYVKTTEKVYVFRKGTPKNVIISVRSAAENQKGKVSVPLPEGWASQPSYYDFELTHKGEEQTFTFTITPPEYQSDISITPLVEANQTTYTKEMINIDYDHIPFQSVLLEADAKLVNVDIEIGGNYIAYIEGAGDDIPQSLEQVGYQVDMIEVNDIDVQMLSKYNAVVMGIRAYNKWDELRFKQKELLEYVQAGGTMVVQYNTSRGLKTDQLGPYNLSISRDRVAVEDAPVTILAPNHPVMTTPNKITSADFEGWVQERGLYFPDEWDEKYTAILSCHDPGESDKKGGLLVAPYGDGWYIYTGYSWFRELPAGVPGAFRIFANMLSLGNTVRP